MLYQRMRCFLEVAEHLNFTQAAKNLFVSQQAVTRQISALEEELGFPLFYRTTRQVTLTPAGKVLVDDFTQINRQIESSIQRARRMAELDKGLVRVGFLSALSREGIILPVTDHLKNRHLNMEFEIQLLDFVELRNQLLHNQIDLCITTSNDYTLWPDTQANVLLQKQFQVFFSDRHPLAAQAAISLEDLGRYTQLFLPQDNLMPGVEQWGRKIPSAQRRYCPDISTLLVHLELGEGFSLLTKVFEGHEQKNLRYWPVPFPEAHAEIVCITRKNPGEGLSGVVRELMREKPLEM